MLKIKEHQTRYETQMSVSCCFTASDTRRFLICVRNCPMLCLYHLQQGECHRQANDAITYNYCAPLEEMINNPYIK